MDPFLLCLGFGFAGLIAMAFVGAAHGGGARLGGHSSGHSGAHLDVHVGQGHVSAGVHTGHAGSATVAAHGHASAAAHPHADSGGSLRSSRWRGTGHNWLANWLSPRVWFSLLTGLGAGGFFIKAFVPLEPWRFVVAALIALAWEQWLVSPIWRLCLGFASTPARTLESAVAEDATAISNFDGDGCGMVSVVLGGHEVRMLARLSHAAAASGHRVHAGETLWIESVDAARNTCTVALLQPPQIV